MKNQKFKNRNFIYALFLGFTLVIISCTPEEEECETKTVCYPGGGCIETPVGNCF
ncbi:hypothetical protein [Polaribacter butkevichii]|uniref:hypothetical protein n=1 Tax=Polaribacter butkevichii TaxID=218490 RepID=UPI001475D8A4|nr:hypothetical protein [Polaribacter butkevichii]